MAFSCKQQLGASRAATSARKTCPVVVASTTGPKPSAMRASLAAAGAALLLGVSGQALACRNLHPLARCAA